MSVDKKNWQKGAEEIEQILKDLRDEKIRPKDAARKIKDGAELLAKPDQTFESEDVDVSDSKSGGGGGFESEDIDIPDRGEK